MIIIGNTYLYQGREVVVDDGDHLEHVWVVTVKATGNQIAGITTTELKELSCDHQRHYQHGDHYLETHK